MFGLLPVRDLFVGMFASVAALLWAYKGHNRWESWLLNGAAIGLLVVATCPMEWSQPRAVAHDAAESMAQDRERAEYIAKSEISDASKEVADALPAEIAEAEQKAQYLANNLPDTPQDGWSKSWPGRLHYVGAFGFFFGIAMVCWGHGSRTLAITTADANVRKWYASLYVLYAVLMALLPVCAAAIYLGPIFISNFPKWPDAVFWLEFGGVGVFIAYWWTKNVEFRQFDRAWAAAR